MQFEIEFSNLFHKLEGEDSNIFYIVPDKYRYTNKYEHIHICFKQIQYCILDYPYLFQYIHVCVFVCF